MDIEFHYYITFILCRKAGFNSDDSFRIYDYDPNRWRHAAIEKKEMALDIFDRYWGKHTFFDSDWYKFQEAVKDHRRCAMERLRPIYHSLGVDSL